MEYQIDRPRRARLAVRVGVTGHRREDLAGASPQDLEASIEQVLQEVQRLALEIHEQTSGTLYSTELPQLVLLSSLAEGADQIVAEKASAMGFELQCPLPFAADDYSRGFDRESKGRFDTLLSQARSIVQLEEPPDEKARPAAYLAAGRMILSQSDILLAVWDGAPAKGVGGTAQIVEEAGTRDIPTVWIGSKPPHVTRLKVPEVSRESLAPNQQDDSGQALSRLGGYLKGILLPSEKSFAGRSYSELDKARAFFAEKPASKWPGWIFTAYRFFWTGPKKGGEELQAEWNRFIQSRDDLDLRYKTFFHHRFQWADNLAKSYVGKYRDSFVSSYLLGAFAVLFAFFGVRAAHLAGPDPYEAHLAGVRWFVFELLAILVILITTLFGWRHRWHERWMDYRPLAESLRQMKFLDPLGRVPPSSKVPAHLAAGDPGRTWFNWYFRALVRHAGMIGGPPKDILVLNSSYLEGFRNVLREAIDGQIEYHKNNYNTFHKLKRHSHFVGQGLFFVAAVGCALHLIHMPRLEFLELESVLGFVAIVLPGFGAALSAILHQGEFERIALRSETLERRLEELKGELTQPLTPATSQALGRVAETFSDIMMSEMVDWRFAFLGKGLELP